MSVTNGTAYEFKISNEASVFLATFISLQVLVGSIANFIVIITILGTRQLRERSEDRLILNLAVADFLGVTFILPWHCYKTIQGSIPIRDQIFNQFLDTLIFHSGGNTVLAIAVDRFIAVIFPLRHKTIMTRKTTMIMAVLSWGMAAALAILDLLGKLFTLDSFETLHFIYDFFVLFAIVVLYSIVFYCIVKENGVISNQGRNVGIEYPMASRRLLFKTTITTLGLAGSYCLTWLPDIVHKIYAIVKKISVESNLTNTLWIYPFAYLSSCVDPFTYALRTKRFKAAFYRKIWSKVFRQTGPLQDPRRFSVPSIR